MPKNENEAADGFDAARPDVTRDGFLDGALTLLQPAHGYRAGGDAVLLAAAVPAVAGESVLDVGAGIGAVALALAHRVRELRVDGIELQAELVRLGAENARVNRLQARVVLHQGDLAAAPSAILAKTYDQVVTNPPYHDGAGSRAAPERSRALARSESHVALAEWLAFCLARLRPGGTLTLIHRADRLDEVLGGLGEGTGGTIVYPLWPGRGRAAKRVIVQTVKASRVPLTVAPGLILHRADGRHSEAAEAILRRGAALRLRPGEA